MSDFLIGDSGLGPRLDGEQVKKLIHEEADRERRYLEFAQNQAKEDRAYFKYLFGWTVTFIGALVLAAGTFGYRSVEQLRDDVKTSVNVELQKAHNDVSGAVDGMKSQARKELDSTRTEVRKQTPETMKNILITSRFANDRMAAIDNYPAEDRSILPLLVQLIESDGSITVVNTAFGHFNALTKQTFQFPDYAGVKSWWNQNKGNFQ